MNSVYGALKADLYTHLPEGAAVRFSRDGDSLFMTDPRRFSAPRFPGLWRVRVRGGLWFFTPETEIVERICREKGFPENALFPDGPAGHFAALLARFTEAGEADPAFTLSLLRAFGAAALGQTAPVVLPPLKAAYARCLAEKKRARTRETALIALETALTLEGSPGP